jgi:hypothetical protein
MAEATVEFEIVKHIGIISTNRSGWNREVNLVSWNKAKPKIDVRDWSPNHDKMGKGLTFEEFEAKRIAEIFNEYFKE